MAGSRCPNLFGADSLHIDSAFTPARTPGPLGSNDAGDPDALAILGDTPGPLGVGDHADPMMLVPPLNFDRVVRYQIFEESVLQRHIARSAHRGKRHPVEDIPDSELAVVEGPYKLRKGPAQTCRKLLQQARIDLANEQAVLLKMTPANRDDERRKIKKKGEVPPTEVTAIGITSAYRSPAYDSALWHRYFRNKYYPVTYPERARLSCWEGGAFGWQATQSLVDLIAKRKAAPGFSNHSNGIAVDFFTVEGGRTLAADTGQSNKGLRKVNAHWEKSWFYMWLEKHKGEYGIERIPTEAWHWEFHEKAAARAAAPER